MDYNFISNLMFSINRGLFINREMHTVHLSDAFYDPWIINRNRQGIS